MVKKIVNVVKRIYVSVLHPPLEENVFVIYLKIKPIKKKMAPIASLLGTQRHTSNVEPFFLKRKSKK